MIRLILFQILILSILSCASNATKEIVSNKTCSRTLELLSDNSKYPELEFEMNWSRDSLRIVVQSLYKENLCDRCARVPVHVKLNYNQNQIKLKVDIEFDYQCCSNCPVPIRTENYFTILLNSRDQILAESKITDIETLSDKIYSNWKEEEFDKLRFEISWQENSSRKALDNILTSICDSYVMVVKEKYESDLCEMDANTVNQIKQEFPLLIQFGVCIPNEVKIVPWEE